MAAKRKAIRGWPPSNTCLTRRHVSFVSSCSSWSSSSSLYSASGRGLAPTGGAAVLARLANGAGITRGRVLALALVGLGSAPSTRYLVTPVAEPLVAQPGARSEEGAGPRPTRPVGESPQAGRRFRALYHLSLSRQGRTLQPHEAVSRKATTRAALFAGSERGVLCARPGPSLTPATRPLGESAPASPRERTRSGSPRHGRPPVRYLESESGESKGERAMVTLLTAVAPLAFVVFAAAAHDVRNIMRRSPREQVRDPRTGRQLGQSPDR